METLRKKLHTDDDILWLNHEKSLREQGIPDDQMLLLRKKLFFSDINVDRNDPVQLNLMYIQVNSTLAFNVNLLPNIRKIFVSKILLFEGILISVNFRTDFAL